MVALETTALSLAKTIVQKAAAVWIADRRTAEERKKELRALLTPGFRRGAPEQRFLDEAASDLASLSHEFRGLDDGERVAALLAVSDAFEHADLTDRALFDVDVDAAKLARLLRAGQPRGEDRRRARRGGRRVLRRGPGPGLQAIRACGRPGAGVRRQVVGGDPEPAL